MKKVLLFILFATSLSSGLLAQNMNLSAITDAISAGNAEALGKYFDDKVEVAVKDSEKTYTKNDAINIVKEFFGKNKPTSFKQVHQGASKGQDSQYVIGNMTSQSGAYRVYVFMKVANGNYLIQELRFDKS